ncbi:MAG: MFS transporter [Chloroflexota bacterium]|nr:MFS transporter [Chloroflexota bacterium]
MSAGSEPSARRNFWALVTDGALFSVGQAFFDMNTIAPLFIASFTSAPALIGAAAAIKTAGFYIPQLPTALAIRRLRRVKGFFLTLAVIGRVGMLGTVALALAAGQLPGAWVVGLFLALYALLMFTDGASAVPWFDLIGRTVPQGRRGRLFGMMQVWGGVGAIAAGIIIQRVLAANLGFSTTYALLFALGAAALVGSAVAIVPIREPAPYQSTSIGHQPAPSGFLTLLREPHLQRVGLAQIAAGTLQLALPFYVIYARTGLHLGDAWIGGFVLAQTVGGAVGGLIWGRVADHLGALPVIYLSASLLVAIPLLALMAGDAQAASGAILVLVFGMAGAAAGGSRVGFWKYVLDLVDPLDRRLYTGLVNSANSPSLLMPLVGSVVLAAGGFDRLFLLTAAAGVGALVTALRLPKPRRPDLESNRVRSSA